MRAGRTVAGWVASRVILFVVALGALIVAATWQDGSSHLRSQVLAWMPDAKRLGELERQRGLTLREVDALRTTLNGRLDAAHRQSPAELARWLAQLDHEIAARESRRLDAFDLVLSGGETDVLVEQARNEATLHVLRWTRQELLRVLRSVADLALTEPQAIEALNAARTRHATNSAAYWQAKRELQRFEQAHPLAVNVPFERLGLQYADRRDFLVLRGRKRQAAAQVIESREVQDRAERTLERIRTAKVTVARPLSTVDPRTLAALDAAIDARRRSIEATRRSLHEILGQAGRLAWTALWIVAVLSLLPLALKSFWYFVMAPLAARQPPIRVAPEARPTTLAELQDAATHISAVTLDVHLAEGEELLVHPEYLQSLAQPGDKRTRWLLDAGYPFMSLAAGMVALTRIRGAGYGYAVSSRRDPLAEVGIVKVPAGGQFVLQPRHLVGLVQRADRPIRISSRWRFGLGAWITLQFRWLVFHGPGRLIVSGCRGVRIEEAGSGRSVDQAATIGFSANLDCVPRRSATFGAYLLGVNGLFDDGFARGPGVYVYEEMPQGRRRAGLGGRGLEGVTDVVLRAFGV